MIRNAIVHPLPTMIVVKLAPTFIAKDSIIFPFDAKQEIGTYFNKKLNISNFIPSKAMIRGMTIITLMIHVIDTTGLSKIIKKKYVIETPAIRQGKDTKLTLANTMSVSKKLACFKNTKDINAKNALIITYTTTELTTIEINLAK